MTPPPSFSTPPQIPNITTSERPLVTTTVFAATTPENTPFVYHASTSTNPNLMICPAFVETNYEILESLLRERQRQISNEDLRTELEYSSEDYDEEREMEPRPEPRRLATLTLWLRSPRVRRQRERVVGFEDAPNREGNKRERNAEGIRPSEIEAREGHQPSTNMGGGNLPPNGTLLSHHAQPFIPSCLHIPTKLMAIHVNPYSQPSANLVYGQALNFPFQTQMGNPLAGGTFTYHTQEGYIPQAFTNNSVPSYNGLMHPTVTPSSSVTLFVCWIEDYPLPNRLKMPSQIGSYDGKGDLDNFLHLFEGAICMQKWLMPVACHMFTYTLKDSTRIWWNSQKTGSILNYEDLKAKFQSHFSQQKKFTKTHLAVHNIKQREGESTRAFITRYTDDTLQILGLHEEQHFRFCSLLENKKFGQVSLHGPSIHLKRSNGKDLYMGCSKKGKRIEDDSTLPRDKITNYSPIWSKVPERSSLQKANTFEQPPRFPGANWSEDKTRYCHFHEDYRHETNQCRELKHQIEEAVKSGQLAHLVKGAKEKKEKTTGTSSEERKKEEKKPILDKVYSSADPGHNQNVPLGRQVNRVYLDEGSSCEVIYEHYFLKLKPSIRSLQVDSYTPLVGFSGEQSWPLGEIPLEIRIGEGPIAITKRLTFVIVKSDSPHNLLLGRTAMQQMGIVVVHSLMSYKGFTALEVEELTKAGILREVKYQTWVSNPMVVKKDNGKWKLRVDFTNINKSCIREPHPLPTAEQKAEGLHKYRLKCFLDAYKGYHHIPIAEEDEEKNSIFYKRGGFLLQKTTLWPEKCRGHLSKAHRQSFRPPDGKKCKEEGVYSGLLITKQGIRVYPSKVPLKERRKDTPFHENSEKLYEWKDGSMDERSRRILLKNERILSVITNDSHTNKGRNSNNVPRKLRRNPELKYPELENLILVLMYAARKLRRASSSGGSGAGLMVVSPEGKEYTYAMRFAFETTNNEAEYEALLAGLRIAKEMEIRELIIFVDSHLVVN
ncbi:reverse transcriptase domain-containing protein [Tanacetum coccineum]